MGSIVQTICIDKVVEIFILGLWIFSPRIGGLRKLAGQMFCLFLFLFLIYLSIDLSISFVWGHA